MGRLAFRLACATHCLFLHHGHSRSIHLHIQDRKWLADDDRQVQLHSSLNLHLFVHGDILSDRLRGAFYGFGGHLQIGEEFQLLPAAIEGGLLAYDGLHPAHSWREPRASDVQFAVSGELPIVTARTEIVGTRDLHWADCSEDDFRAQFPVVGLLAASTRKAALIGCRDGEAQEFGQCRCARLVHGRAHSHLDGFQIETALA